MTQTWFALGTFDAGAGDFPGQVIGDLVYNVRDYLPYASIGEVLADWDAAFPALASVATDPTTIDQSTASLIYRPHGLLYY